MNCLFVATLLCIRIPSAFLRSTFPPVHAYSQLAHWHSPCASLHFVGKSWKSDDSMCSSSQRFGGVSRVSEVRMAPLPNRCVVPPLVCVDKDSDTVAAPVLFCPFFLKSLLWSLTRCFPCFRIRLLLNPFSLRLRGLVLCGLFCFRGIFSQNRRTNRSTNRHCASLYILFHSSLYSFTPVDVCSSLFLLPIRIQPSPFTISPCSRVSPRTFCSALSTL